jgi:hypothetical protein
LDAFFVRSVVFEEEGGKEGGREGGRDGRREGGKEGRRRRMSNLHS